MPTYEYMCLECQSKFDVFATLAQKEKGLSPECPNCHSREVIQVFGSIAVIGGSTRGGFDPGALSGCGPSAGPGCC